MKGNKDLLRMLIQKERMIELAFEGHRYYDARRWMIAQQEFPGPEYSLNLLATSYEDSWSRTSNVWKVVLGYLSLSIISSLSIKNN
ncbi:RagB/SusD family nutrient uptake outer membrane protein [Bacteroides thetaiotaomicron]|uniref:RagB/SusD family nutrient uptake outer membrane protein n=1 Tax=Bacteroides thetaiotaomicron TaxID=818 RepID=UPI0021652965|nr:RagB/SusD family nutrient uptake outer membrane protein [Bacteroides thetaiotaomicron]MCS2621041.1 RagB/SusD family nutrient uptake outer membrane protein [Bacteroides thetaiotaomicron]